MKSNAYKALQRAKKRKDDEYYTTREMAEEFLEPFWSQLDGKRIFCPCDGDESEIVKLLKEKGLEVKNTSDDYKNHLEEMKDYDVIITNPPFSILGDFIEDINNTGRDFIFIRPATLLSIELELLKKGRVKFKEIKNTDFKNGKQVAVGTITTLQVEQRPLKYKQEGVYHITDGICIVSRMDFIPDNYYGRIGLPVTAVNYNLEEFEILYKDHTIYKHEKKKKHQYHTRIIVQRKTGGQINGRK